MATSQPLLFPLTLVAVCIQWDSFYVLPQGRVVLKQPSNQVCFLNYSRMLAAGNSSDLLALSLENAALNPFDFCQDVRGENAKSHPGWLCSNIKPTATAVYI